ncbi:MAG: 50S ribosomal protein L17 [Deltaproteobacteria bacterium]|nr:MAG: 50S ribosomal protein L17 [Deltaproteobacteria bacterium]
MRHRKAGKELSRNTSHRRAMLRNMVTSLFKYEQIETTDTKAKAVRPIAEKLITLAKRGDLHARRQALSYMQDKTVTHRLFEEIKERYLDRQGGYVRIVKKGFRKGDGAPVSIVQLLPAEEGKKEKKKKGRKKKADKAPSVKKTVGSTKKEGAPVPEKEGTPEVKEAVETSNNTDTVDEPEGSKEA